MLREVSTKLSKLETRAKRAFPSVAATKPIRRKAQQGERELPQITSDDAMRIYDRVVEKAGSGAHEEAMALLGEMALADLLVLHKEVGLPRGKSKPSKKAIVSDLLGRVKQSVMLSQHSNRIPKSPGEV